MQASPKKKTWVLVLTPDNLIMLTTVDEVTGLPADAKMSAGVAP